MFQVFESTSENIGVAPVLKTAERQEIIVKEVETFTKVALSNVGKDLSKEGTDENDEGGGGKKNNKKDR